MTPTQPAPLDDAGALDQMRVASKRLRVPGTDGLPAGPKTADELDKARAHLAARLAELEMEAAGATTAYERFTAYTIVHNGAGLYCSSDMRDAYAEMRERATRAEAELAALKPNAERLSQIYFEIAAEAIGENAVRAKRDTAIDTARGAG